MKKTTTFAGPALVSIAVLAVLIYWGFQIDESEAKQQAVAEAAKGAALGTCADDKVCAQNVERHHEACVKATRRSSGRRTGRFAVGGGELTYRINQTDYKLCTREGAKAFRAVLRKRHAEQTEGPNLRY